MRKAKSRLGSAACAGPASLGSARSTLGVLLLLLVVALTFGASSASAEIALLATGEYGKEGSPATGVGGGCRIAYQTENHRLYLLSDGNIYGLDRTAPGTATQLPGYPVSVSLFTGCGDPDLAVDNSAGASKNNIYAVPSSTQIHGFNSAAAPLGSPWPVDVGGITCGVAVTNTGEVWGGNYSGSSVAKFTSAGVAAGSKSLGYQACKIAVDNTNNDLYAVRYLGANAGTLTKYTAASGYTSTLSFGVAGSSNGGIVVDGARNRVYVTTDSNTVKVYDTDTAALLETIEVGGSAGDLAVDEASGAFFVTVGSGPTGVIKEFAKVNVPTLTVGTVVGTTIHANVDPDGAGDVTGCTIEYGTSAPAFPSQPYESSVPCEPATPYASPTDVSAALAGLAGETLYHYRIVASNANGTKRGADNTFTPHFVEDLATLAPSNVTKTSATLKASFTGNGEDTHYYFEWGPGTGDTYPNKTAVPPGDDAGSGTGTQNVSTNLPGLTSDSTYHYRVVATTVKGTSTAGKQVFSTLFSVLDLTTELATNVKAESATLNGSWTGDGTQTNYYFEWGFSTTSSYEHVTAIPPGSDGGSAVGAQSVSFGLADLAPNTTYRYRIVATNPSGISVGEDKTLKTPKLPSAKYLPTNEFSNVSATVNAMVNPEGSGSTTYHFEYGADTNYGTSTSESASVGSDTTDHSASAVLSGLSAGTVYHFRIVATSPSGVFQAPDRTFTTAPNLPTITATSASGQTPVGADLSAQVRPGFGPTLAYFEYGPTVSYGSQTIPGPSIGSDDVDHEVSASLSGLSPGTTYHYRAVAINFAGSAHSADRTFSTAGQPRVTGASSSSVGQSTASLSAQIIPSLAATTYHFEYGTTVDYGSSTSESGSIGSDDSAHSVAATIPGLTPATTYHFRAVATNVVGITAGQDGTFTTKPTSAESKSVAPVKCKRGFVKRAGKCVKKKRKRRSRHRRNASHRNG